MRIEDIQPDTWYAVKRGAARPRLIVSRRTAIFIPAGHTKTPSGARNEEQIAFAPDARMGDVRRGGYGTVGYLAVFPTVGDFSEWVGQTQTPPELAAVAGHLAALLGQIPVGRKDAVPSAPIRAWAKERGIGFNVVQSRDVIRLWIEHAAAELEVKAAESARAEIRRTLSRQREQAWRQIAELCKVLDIRPPHRSSHLDQVSMEPGDLVGILRLAAGQGPEQGG